MEGNLLMRVLENNIKLLGQIHVKKRDMYKKAKYFGYTHPCVITCSQELDTLLNKYQKFQVHQ
ncbi:aspartyl-phosphate phosphatase Spo0E family protein [Paenisporosarcina indica]|uniref:aspartyl-phosphate phosphatase Spo0E family protein n=1 Tax=Paenisporosarcina indica TaxID=650093 RepID=UPI00318375FC